MINYISITQEDGTPFDNYFWSFLGEYNRLAIEVTDWNKRIESIPDTGLFGLRMPLFGDYTIFRKHKVTGVVNYANITANDCGAVSTQVVFTVSSGDTADGFIFKRILTITELAGNILTQFLYGYSLTETEEITNWQTSNEFDLNVEGVYYFDVKITGQTGTVGKQAVELYKSISDITGAEDSDHAVFGDNSSEN
jgi:hypothetical protein